MCVDATLAGSIAHLLNHSCAPCCHSRTITVAHPATGRRRDHIVIFASRDIAVGEELTYDYRFAGEEKLPCNCGAPTCRGMVNAPGDDEGAPAVRGPRAQQIIERDSHRDALCGNPVQAVGSCSGASSSGRGVGPFSSRGSGAPRRGSRQVARSNLDDFEIRELVAKMDAQTPPPPAKRDKLEAITAQIDEINAADPKTIPGDSGRPEPYRLAYSRWLTQWVLKLDPNACDELLILARGKTCAPHV
ncbi:trithorax-like protein, histone-lysine N-methyltransferase [Monoraphidium neglectum]|uniref:[histone H3]-lysine(4) N-trimethyltransferase n=1 Tax=Monoraphidium neglectum TaxID=145388 RepID=A0A0D2KB61_9CHLO|nr:trithorax-like protein, histone-lysine N-methyltransferase [Monoraphidium neglectum]KIY93188.1 trithorax-like protein, histone-lysine N-methyltransferase [Monoraphidium neglectum]|eukprot:XP_013892208.1 trithorax-like protein, histone-lysine N-methyltransferase [Monoraphidium neglectum]